MLSSRMRRSSVRFIRNVAENTFCFARMCLAISTFSSTVREENSLMFWKVLAMPSSVILSGVGARTWPVNFSGSSPR